MTDIRALRADLLDIPTEDQRSLYGGHDRHVDPRTLGDGFPKLDKRPEETFDPVELGEKGGVGYEFRSADEELPR